MQEDAGGSGEGGVPCHPLTMWAGSTGTFPGQEEAAPDGYDNDTGHRPRTISNSNEHEVTNGFVKNGSSLPYVYETSETGKFLEESNMFTSFCWKSSKS